MALDLPDHFVWDFWFADDGERFHIFYLHAPRSLGHPDLRHRNARIGHASSTDLREWTHHGRVFDAGPPRSFDGSATWTGSVVCGPDRLWRMFYTGSLFLSPDSPANIETIGLATSPDLFTWTKQPGPVCTADARFYERLGDSIWPEEAWRDPWVFWREDDRLWHMLITGRAANGDELDRGVVAHATSPDLEHWAVAPALSQPGAGFAHLEVFQVVEVAGQNHLVFCCDAAKLAGARAGQGGGIWSLPVGDMPGPVDPSKARLIVGEHLYAGRVVIDRDGNPNLFGFNNVVVDGRFVGGVSDPLPLTVDGDGYLALKDRP